MSHKAQVRFCKLVKKLYPDFFYKKAVVDVGSLDINGNNRKLFKKCYYSGIDLHKGKNVDYVGHAHRILPIVSRVMRERIEQDYQSQVAWPVSTIISTEALEHDCYWKLTLKTIYNHVMSGGLIVITAAGVGRPEHGTTKNAPDMSPGTNDYYGNISNEMMASVYKPDMFQDYFLRQHPENKDMQFFGIKKKQSEVFG